VSRFDTPNSTLFVAYMDPCFTVGNSPEQNVRQITAGQDPTNTNNVTKSVGFVTLCEYQDCPNGRRPLQTIPALE